MDEQTSEFNTAISCVNKRDEIVHSGCDLHLIDKNKCPKKNKLSDNKKESKSSKITSLLDSYCNTLNESTDFVECELANKFRNESQKTEKKEFQNGSQVNEVMVCEICKEDITLLDIYNRGIHVNECIDKQISSASEDKEISSTLPSANEDVFILECPLCFKHFSSPELRSNHIKKCGKSKGLSLQSILKALELQERHALERISLGLPAKPVKPVKTSKNPINKKAITQPKSKVQSDIQLAKALSLSLTSSSQQGEAGTSEQITSVILKPPAVNQRPGKKTTKILSSTPLLVLRSDEDRKKLLLEKVENILTFAIDSGHNSSAGSEIEITEDKQDIVDQEALTLWRLSSKSSDKCQYYVVDLMDWIKPSDVEMGSKLLHLSQIPGHEIVTQLPCEYTFDTPDEKVDADIKTSSLTSISNQHTSSLIESLSSLVASSWMSDVNIHTACGTVIPAHKLLLAVRCPPLKEDFNFCSGKECATLKWENVAFDAALQFINFIYTGNINVNKDMVSDLFYLAKKYEVYDLQALLHSNNNDEIMSEMETHAKVLTAEKEHPSPSSSCPVETIDSTENIVYESQENMDLEIVYNCIDSCLEPLQLTVSQSSILNDNDHFKCTQKSETKDNYDLSCKVDDFECVSASAYSNNTLVCDNHFSSTDSSPSSPLKLNVSDCKNNTNIASPEKAFMCDNLSPKNNGSTSPEIFDIDDSENDTDNLSDSETTESLTTYSQKSALGPSNTGTDFLDLITVESNSSDDSVRLLPSSFISYNNIYNTSERTKKSTSFSPKYSEINSFSPTLKNASQNSPVLEQNRREERVDVVLNGSYSELLTNQYSDLKSPSVPYSQISDEKRYQSPDNCNTPLKLNSPITLNSQKLLSDFQSVSEDKVLSVTGVKDGLKSFSRGLLDNKSLTGESSAIINLIENDNISETNSVSGEYNKSNCNLFVKSLSCQNEQHSTIKSDGNAIQLSPVINSASHELLICDSDSDSKSERSAHYEASPVPNYINISQNKIKTDVCSSVNSPPSSSDAVFDSFQYFDQDISSPNKDYFQTSNSSEFTVKKSTSPDENKSQSSDHSKITEKACVAPASDYLQSSKILVHTEKEKNATSCSKPGVAQPQFQLSDSPVTPLPDYKSMMTPDIKQALKRIGVKALPRKKAVAILSHVYNETHPLIDAETNTVKSFDASEMQSNKEDKVKKSKKRKQTTLNSETPVKKQKKENHSKEALLASPESDESNSENPEWLGCVPEMSFSQNNNDSPTKPSNDVIESIKFYIQSNEELYHNVLTYIPLNLVEFHQELKKNDIKISIQKLMDFLDEQCITFTCPRKEETRKKQTARAQRFRKKMIAKLSQQTS